LFGRIDQVPWRHRGNDAGFQSIATDLFLRSIKMIIALLVFFGLVSGIVAMGDPKAVGRTGIRALSWFLIASLVVVAASPPAFS